VQKLDGFIWCRPLQPLDLIRGSQSSKNEQINDKNAYRHNYGKTGPERRLAISKVMKQMDIRKVEDETHDLFVSYLSRINDTEIILAPNPKKYFFGDILTLPYRTRFNDEGRKVEQIKKYERIFDETAQKYKHAVMLTLTTDPKLQDGLWDYNKKISKNLNRLMSYLASKNDGKRHPYLSVFEFQGNGRLHLHIVFFNVRYLIQKSKMVRLWKKYGQGEVIDFKNLHSDMVDWQWTHERPKDADDKEPPSAYLKKYLKKNLYDEFASMQYWIYGTRFFSNSRIFEEAKRKLKPKNWYYFFGCAPCGSITKLPGTEVRSNNGPPRYRAPPRARSDIMQQLDKLCRHIHA
jgi:hypothetical protein